MPGAAPAQPALFGADDARPPSADQTDRETDTPKTSGQKADSKSGDAKNDDKRGKGGGWLGGLFTKLSLRAPNQMILPDDTNPTIVWDEEHKRWRDTDAGEGEAPAPPAPRPRRQRRRPPCQSCPRPCEIPPRRKPT
ncbi:jg9947 [Pararge aegeria aegeria]|uniref:Jg9947 protein n=1 Tax=Pararge aegeria aegeria TaxID=348720 RepID=A0A8S4SA71_9NEOP|nr:jg9947 [Pararge aegeria aegeria]